MIIQPDLSQFPPADAGRLHELAQSVETFQLLTTTFELGFFNALETPKKADELAEELALNKALVKKSCDALAGSGFFVKTGNEYALSDFSKTFLLEDSPYYQGALMALLKKTRFERWSSLSGALKNGPVGFERNFESTFDAGFIHAMAQGAIRGSLQETVRILRDDPVLADSRNMLDLGGGHALYSVAFTQLNPSLESTVFDLPVVVENVTKSNISSYGADRVKTIPGDFTKDNLGGGYDLVFASDVLYRPRESLDLILGKIHSGLNDGGCFVSKHWHIDDVSRDLTAVYFDLMFAIRDEADCIYSTADFSEILERNGFKIEQIHDFNLKISPSRIIIARKL